MLRVYGRFTTSLSGADDFWESSSTSWKAGVSSTLRRTTNPMTTNTMLPRKAMRQP
ncbi:Uncharacterised protein [Mycobacteroides abscessus subsp. abscessus]|nr:Uncharacterised protein [Mycobacteroides abscessus subsp. abscessus]